MLETSSVRDSETEPEMGRQDLPERQPVRPCSMWWLLWRRNSISFPRLRLFQRIPVRQIRQLKLNYKASSSHS